MGALAKSLRRGHHAMSKAELGFHHQVQIGLVGTHLRPLDRSGPSRWLNIQSISVDGVVEPAPMLSCQLGELQNLIRSFDPGSNLPSCLDQCWAGCAGDMADHHPSGRN